MRSAGIASPASRRCSCSARRRDRRGGAAGRGPAVPPVLRDGRGTSPRRAVPQRHDRGPAHPGDPAERPAGDRGELPVRADRRHGSDGRERLHVPAAGEPHRAAPGRRPPRRHDRPLRERIALLLHARASQARALLRDLRRAPARRGRRHARSLARRGRRGRRERAHAARISQPGDGDVGDLRRHRGVARGASRHRVERASAERARRQRLPPTRVRDARALRRGAGRTARGLGSAHQEPVREDVMTVVTASQSDVADQALADAGSRRIEWAAREMPVLAKIRERVATERPFKGLRIGACLHVTTETANLAITLRDGGASVALCASNPLSTQDDAAAALVKNERIATFAKKGEDRDTYYRHIEAILETRPQITMDDGADVVTRLHTTRKDLLPSVKGGTEETTTGVIRLRAMAAEGVLAYPVVAVNEARTKHMFDNQYGTGQSAIDGLLRATNILIAGKTAVVCGYGWVGRGVASRFRGMGAIVIIVEVDPLRGLEAAMDGYQVMPIADAARRGDLFVTCTGNVNVIAAKHFETMKDGAILANAGHFNDEIELGALAKQARSMREIRRFVDEYDLGDRKIV